MLVCFSVLSYMPDAILDIMLEICFKKSIILPNPPVGQDYASSNISPLILLVYSVCDEIVGSSSYIHAQSSAYVHSLCNKKQEWIKSESMCELSLITMEILC